MFVKTPQGKRCPFPDGQVVTERPVELPVSTFLKRRLRDGSVLLTTKTQRPSTQQPRIKQKQNPQKEVD